MTWTSLANTLQILLFIVLGTIIWTSKKIRHKILLTLLMPLTFVAVTGAGILVTALVNPASDAERFERVAFPAAEPHALNLERDDGRAYLVYPSGVEAWYEGDDIDPYRAAFYQAVYLREEDDFYVVIYSSDPDRVIAADRFIIPDYQAYAYREDRLYVILRASGEMIPIVDYDLIGHTVDLSGFRLVFDVLITYELLERHLDRIEAVGAVWIDRDPEAIGDLYPQHRYTDTFMTAIHWYTDADPSEITYYAVTRSFSVWADSYGETHGYAYGREGDGITFFNLNETLFSGMFVAEGCVVAKDGVIYFLGTTRVSGDPRGATGYAIFQLSSQFATTEVARLTYTETLDDLSTVSDWITHIPD